MEDLPEEMDALPQNETEFVAMAQKLIALLADNPKFADAPVSADELRSRLNAFIKARDAEVMARVAAMQAKAAAEKAWNALLEAERNQAKTGGGLSAQSIIWN